MSDIIDGLNDKQKEAVLATDGPCLVIAGAGSGKTKVLTHKIAYLMQEKNVKPWNILAITFTNKAANEMKERVEKLVGDVAKDMWIGTFHSICVRILRRYIDRIGFTSSFIIFDSSDQRTLVKQCLKQLNVDDPAAYALKVVGLTAWNKLITVGALVGIFTAMITMLLGGSRLLYALGRDGLLPDSMGSVHAKKMIPDHAVIVSTIVAAIFAGLVPLMELASLINAGTLIAFALISFGIIPLRHRKDIVNDGFKMPLYPVLPVIAGLLSVYFIWMLPNTTKIMVGIWLIVGIIVYATYGIKHSKLQN